MKKTFLHSTTRRVLRFQIRNELLSFWLAHHSFPRSVTELVSVLDMDKLPRADDSEVRKVGIFAIKASYTEFSS